MKTRLDQLMLRDLIELSCGDASVLLDKGESPAESVKIACARQIMTEYKELAAPGQAKMDMIEAEEIQKLRMKERCLRICMALCGQEHADMAKEVLLELDVSEEFIKDEEAIKSRCKAMLDDVRYEISRIEELGGEKEAKKAKTPAEMRKSWFSEIAFVMSTLKMSIDPVVTNAAIYANLVSQASERAKAMAKMPPMMGMFM